jgi:long-chain fatty acid transport protein
MSNRFIQLGAAACLSLGLVLPNQAEALLAGVKATSMAATCTANPIDAFAGAYNPGAIGFLEDRADMGFSWVHAYQRVESSGNAVLINDPSYQAARTPYVFVGEFGINKHFCINTCYCPLDVAVGLVVYNRSFDKTTFDTAIPLLGTSEVGLEYLNETIAPVVAVRYGNHSLGMSLNINVQRLKIDGLENFANPFYSLDPDAVTGKGYDWSTGVGVTFGYLWEPIHCLRLGVAYTPKTHMPRFDKYQGLLVEQGQFPTPERFQFGVAYKPWNCLTLAFDYEFVHWKNIPQLDHDFFLGPNSIGYDNGSGFGWNNQSFYRFGIEYTFRCFDIRAGFRHVNSAFEGENVAVNLLTCQTACDFLTLGGTYHVGERNEISLLYAKGFKKNADGPIPAGLGGGDIRLKQGLQVIGISYGRLL